MDRSQLLKERDRLQALLDGYDVMSRLRGATSVLSSASRTSIIGSPWLTMPEGRGEKRLRRGTCAMMLGKIATGEAEASGKRSGQCAAQLSSKGEGEYCDTVIGAGRTLREVAKAKRLLTQLPFRKETFRSRPFSAL